MIKVDKLVEHDPENGKFGDCMRATIASLLERPSENVPHFFETGCPDTYEQLMDEFLKANGIKVIYTEPKAAFHGKVYHMILGTNVRGVPHAVVGLNGEIVHDPHPDRMGLREIDSYGFIVDDDGTASDKLEDYSIHEKCRG